jgi:hypothetical protein
MRQAWHTRCIGLIGTAQDVFRLSHANEKGFQQAFLWRNADRAKHNGRSGDITSSGLLFYVVPSAGSRWFLSLIERADQPA